MWKYAYQVSENKKIRVIVHTDCKMRRMISLRLHTI